MADYSQEVVNYIGTGVQGRLVSTGIDLTQGTCLVWVWPVGSLNNCMRFTGLTGTVMTGGVAIIPPATGGITSFTSTGFTVRDNGAFPSVNQAGIHYTALVFQDLIGLFLSVGSYHGLGALGPSVVGVTNGSSIIVGGVSPWDVGRYITLTQGMFAPTVRITQYLDATHFRISVVWSGSTSTATMAATQPPQVITTSLTLGARFVNVHGRGMAFRTPDHSGVNSSDFSLYGAPFPLTNLITSGAAGQTEFQVDTSDDVNNGTFIYYYFAFSMISALTPLIATFKATGTGAALDVTLPFSPGFAAARPQVGTAAPENVWKATGQQSGSDSNYIEFGSTSAQGITALGVNKLTLGSLTGALGVDVYGFAMAPGLSTATVTQVDEALDDTSGPDSFGVAATFEAIEGRGEIINVDRTDRWFLERFDIRRRREEHKG